LGTGDRWRDDGAVGATALAELGAGFLPRLNRCRPIGTMWRIKTAVGGRVAEASNDFEKTVLFRVIRECVEDETGFVGRSASPSVPAALNPEARKGLRGTAGVGHTDRVLIQPRVPLHERGYRVRFVLVALPVVRNAGVEDQFDLPCGPDQKPGERPIEADQEAATHPFDVYDELPLARREGAKIVYRAASLVVPTRDRAAPIKDKQGVRRLC